MCVMYVDGTLHIGNDKHSDYCKTTEKMFMCKKTEWDKFQVPGMDIETKEHMFEINQKRYIFKPKNQPTNPNLLTFVYFVRNY